MQSEVPWRAKQFADRARQSDASQRSAESTRGSSEPDFIPCRRPSGSEGARPALGQVRLLAIQVNHADGAPVVSQEVMVNECEAIPLGRDAQMADPAGGFIQYFANGILDSALAAHDVNHGECFSTGCPIRSLNIVQQVSRSIRADGNLSQRSAMREMISTDDEAPQHRQLSRSRDRQHLRFWEGKVAGFG